MTVWVSRSRTVYTVGKDERLAPLGKILCCCFQPEGFSRDGRADRWLSTSTAHLPPEQTLLVNHSTVNLYMTSSCFLAQHSSIPNQLIRTAPYPQNLGAKMCLECSSETSPRGFLLAYLGSYTSQDMGHPGRGHPLPPGVSS